ATAVPPNHVLCALEQQTVEITALLLLGKNISHECRVKILKTIIYVRWI
ncbi:MAG: hypothetical protein ACI91R_002075, partial [Vicingaceae bacterium]